MADPSSYCTAVSQGYGGALHRQYHDTVYGFPTADDNALFGRLLLEINQAGLSWDTVLNKAESIKAAYADFDIATVAAFTEGDIERLLQNPGIIRMRKKIEAAIYNANQCLELQNTHGSFGAWIDAQHPQKEEDWVKLFKKNLNSPARKSPRNF